MEVFFDPMKAPQSGFTLIELLVTVAIAGILASIAYPSYQTYIAKQRVSTAEMDLIGLSMNMETYQQNNTQYPATASNITEIQSALTGWNPVQQADFNYAILSVDNTPESAGYTLQATGTSQMLKGCEITLSSSGARTQSGCPGGSSSW